MAGQQAYGELELYVDGEWIGADGYPGEDILNPATEMVLAKLPHADNALLDRAAEAAARAFPGWRDRTALQRSDILRSAAALLRDRADRIATRMVMDQGKPLAQANQEVQAAALIMEWSAEEGRRAYGRIIPASIPGVQWSVVKEPVGPVAAFTPWNFPAIIPARKIASALAVGCTMVIKPAEETPSTVLEIARALADAGLPKGVLNVVHGVPSTVSERLIAHPTIRKISFTGSTSVGQHLARLAADAGVKRCTMELGGHAPVIVCADADVDLAVRMMSATKYRNAGQVCISPTRFFVEEPIYSRFVEGFTEAASGVRVGDGFDPDVQMGPLAHARRLPFVDDLVADAVGHGASLKTGGKRMGNQGFFYEPTVLADVPETARIMNEEPFGPIATVTPFGSLDDAIAQANRLPVGLAAYAYTQSTATAARLSREVETGMLGINNSFVNMPETPFGGVKQSGYGSEGGIEGMEPYLVTKTISLS